MNGDRPPTMPRHPIYQLGYGRPRAREERVARRPWRWPQVRWQTLRPAVWFVLACACVWVTLYVLNQFDDGDDGRRILPAAPAAGRDDKTTSSLLDVNAVFKKGVEPEVKGALTDEDQSTKRAPAVTTGNALPTEVEPGTFAPRGVR